MNLGEPLLADTEREYLWHAFELPVFEELRGSDGELLAWECDGHAGLHLETDSAIFEMVDGELVVTSLVAVRYPVLRLRTGHTGAIERRTCPCGHRAVRFLPDDTAVAGRRPPAVARQTKVAPRTAIAAAV
jgi:phenylacetate-coenzyme A ligase PaaK-like adenylate-forming protein